MKSPWSPWSIHRSIDPSKHWCFWKVQMLENKASHSRKSAAFASIYKIQYQRRVLNVSKTADIGPQKFNDMSAWPKSNIETPQFQMILSYAYSLVSSSRKKRWLSRWLLVHAGMKVRRSLAYYPVSGLTIASVWVRFTGLVRHNRLWVCQKGTWFNLFRWIQQEMWQIQIRHPDLWRSLLSRPSLRWMDRSLCSGYLCKQVHMACDFQHNVRALMVRASSPMPVSDGHDVIEVPILFTVTTAAPSTTSSQRVTDYATEPGSGDRDIPEKMAAIRGLSKGKCLFRHRAWAPMHSLYALHWIWPFPHFLFPCSLPHPVLYIISYR